MEIAFAIDISETASIEGVENSKEFVKETIRSFADSENDIHFSVMTYSGLC